MSFEEWDIAFLWRCDKCGYEVMFKPHDFMGCVAELRARGWSFHLNDDEGGRDWTHSCANCTRKKKMEQGDLMQRKFHSVKG